MMFSAAQPLVLGGAVSRVPYPLEWVAHNGDGTASASGTALTVALDTATPSALAPRPQHPRHVAELDMPTGLVRWALVARLVALPADTQYRLCVSVGDAVNDRGVALLVRQDALGDPAALEFGSYAPGGTYTALTTPGGVGAVPVGARVCLAGCGRRVAMAWSADGATWSVLGHGLADVLPERATVYLARWGGADGRSATVADVTLEVLA